MCYHPDPPGEVPDDLRDEAFLEVFRDQVTRATKIVDQHLNNGENALVPIIKMFPHGAQDLTFMLYTKSCRLLGYESQGLTDKVREEAQDIINYAGFLLALLEVDP